MFSITVMVGAQGFTLMYRTQQKAEESARVLRGGDPMIAIEDDFGQSVAINRQHLSGFMVEDLEKSKLAHVERALHIQRTQALAQKTAEADPGLKFSMMNRGPAMVSPMGLNGRG